VPLTDETLVAADVVVIVTNHKAVDYQRVVNLASLVVDTRHATALLAPGKARIVSLTPDAPRMKAPAAHAR
jgi:UDP-N-acetyl-D-glucosamine dehydrogenase